MCYLYLCSFFHVFGERNILIDGEVEQNKAKKKMCASAGTELKSVGGSDGVTCTYAPFFMFLVEGII